MNADTLKCGHISVSEFGFAMGMLAPCPVCHTPQEVVRPDDSGQGYSFAAVANATGEISMPVPSIQVPAVINGTAPERSYGCSWGCGNPYDYVIINVADGTTEFLCLVCLLKLCQEMIGAVLNPDDPDVKAAMAEYANLDRAPMTSGKVRKRGKNAPADFDDDSLIEAFDSRLTADELPEEFR